MLRHTRRRLSHLMTPGLDSTNHTFNHASYSDGTHRVAPNTAHRAWEDVRSPMSRLKRWVSTPVSRATVILAWSITAIVGYYGWTVQGDAKVTYLLNSTLQRTVHLQMAKADADEQRLKAAEAAVMEKAAAYPGDGAPSDSLKDNYELVLARERGRAQKLSERSDKMVQELHKLRKELKAVTADAAEANAEVSKLRKVISRLQEANNTF